MTPGPGIEPGTHFWEASALTTAPTLLPEGCTSSAHLVTVVQHLLMILTSVHVGRVLQTQYILGSVVQQLFAFSMVRPFSRHLRCLVTVWSTFQQLDFDRSMLPHFISWCKTNAQSSFNKLRSPLWYNRLP